MNRKEMKATTVQFFFIAVLLFSCLVFPADLLRDEFLNPPDSAKPWVYWYWMNGNITREGITRDLESMASSGIGGAYLMTIGKTDPKTTPLAQPVETLSEQWWDTVRYAVKEAARLNLKIAMNACDGWSLAGGPWITPELSMQELVWTSRIIEGGKPFEDRIEQPVSREGYYRDIAVFAYPVSDQAEVTSTVLNPKATTNLPDFDPQPLVKGLDAHVTIPNKCWIQYEFTEPFTCRSVVLSPSQLRSFQLHRMEIQVSQDGENFHSLGRLTPSRHGWQENKMQASYAILPATGRFFRFIFDPADSPEGSENLEGAKPLYHQKLKIGHIELRSSPCIHQWEGKAGFRWRSSSWTTDSQVPDVLCIKRDRIIDLTNQMSSDGMLQWTPGPGRWKIQRIGYTTTGIKNTPTGNGVGLECDKFNPDAVRLQFDKWFGEALKQVGPEFAGKTLCLNHTDSWEAGSQNYSPVFRDQFIKRRGYDPLLWLPAMTGVPVESAELSERFLYDVRRTIADLVCDNFYKPLSRLTHERNCGLSAESMAPTMMSDGLQHQRYVDYPMGEFWFQSASHDKPNDILDAVSGAHIYGKQIVQAEAFTQLRLKWNEHPFLLKALGDHQFALGINRFVLHVWPHQAFDRVPGVTLTSVGTFFSGHQTWHMAGKAWFDYLARCQSLLQQGLPVVDVCYFTGEEVPTRAFLPDTLTPALPCGYTYDSINPDALHLASAENGQLVLPGDMRYRLLVLPSGDRMTPQTAKKIGELAKAGIQIIGARPDRSWSLTNYPACDKDVQDIVTCSWKSVLDAQLLEPVLKKLKIEPDVIFLGADMTPVDRQEMGYKSPPFSWNHRQKDNADIYFISNQDHQAGQVEVSFRVQKRVPEIWDAAKGTIQDAAVWRREKGRTIVTMIFSPAQSLFVVFRRSADKSDSIVEITPSRTMEGGLPEFFVEDGKYWAFFPGLWTLHYESGKTVNYNAEKVPEKMELSGPWQVEFEKGRGAPNQIELTRLESLSHHEDFGVKHFSGTATYKTVFQVPSLSESNASEFERNEQRIFLVLSRVENIARVCLNGKDLGVLWESPYRLEVTEALQPGRNELDIAVTNTWKNRLVGDAGVLPEKRIGWMLYRDLWFEPAEPLEESGLIGPVWLVYATSVNEK